MEKEWWNLIRRFLVYALCIALLITDSSRFGSFATEDGAASISSSSGNNEGEISDIGAENTASGNNGEETSDGENTPEGNGEETVSGNNGGETASGNNGGETASGNNEGDLTEKFEFQQQGTVAEITLLAKIMGNYQALPNGFSFQEMKLYDVTGTDQIETVREIFQYTGTTIDSYYGFSLNLMGTDASMTNVEITDLSEQVAVSLTLSEQIVQENEKWVLYHLVNGELTPVMYTISADYLTLQFETQSLGIYLIAKVSDTADDIMKGYQNYQNATKGLTKVENDVVYTNATIYNYDGLFMNSLVSGGMALAGSSGTDSGKMIFTDGNTGVQARNANPIYNKNNIGKSNATVCMGILENQLNAGVPIFKMIAPDFFSTNEYTYEGKTAKRVYENVEFPLLYDTQTGYLTFDSDLTSVFANKEFYENDDLKKYDMYYNDTKQSANAHGQYKGVWGLEGFWPVNKNSEKDVHFGMRLDVKFVMNNPEGIEYKFSGDDDVWVFIDGVLVLDLGGIHAAADGSIDFEKQTSTVSQGATYSYNTASNKAEIGSVRKNIQTAFPEELGNLADGKVHTMTIFYLERGAYESNCRMTFNLQAITEEERVDEVKATKQASLVDWNERTYNVTISADSASYANKTTVVGNGIKKENGRVEYSETQNVTIKDVIDDRFYIPEEEIQRIYSTENNVKIDVPTNDCPYYVVTWYNQTVGSAAGEEHGWSRTILIKAKENYFGGNNVPTNVNQENSQISSYVECENSGKRQELPQPIVNVKVPATLEGTYDVIFEGESLSQEVDENGNIVKYFTKEDEEKFITVDSNGKVIAIGQYTDLRDVENITYQFKDSETKEIVSVEEIRQQRPTKDKTFAFTLTYTLKEDGTNVTGNMKDANDNYCKNAQEASMKADYNVYVFHGQITVKKEIKLSEVDLTQGDPIFTFRFTKNDGNQTSYYRSVRFTQSVIENGITENESGEAYVTLQVVFDQIQVGSYTVTELPVFRYALDHFTEASVETWEDQKQTVVAQCNDSSAVFTFSTPVFTEESAIYAESSANRILKGYTTVENTKSVKFYDSDTDILVNRFRVTVKDSQAVVEEISQDALNSGAQN